MSDYEFKIKGLRKTIKRMKSLDKAYPDFIKGVFHNMGLQTLSKVRKLTPVDTGNLRSKWHVNKPKFSKKEITIEIKNNLVYGPPVEYGHRTKNGGFVQGKFMLRRAVDEIERDSMTVLENAIVRFVNKQLEGE